MMWSLLKSFQNFVKWAISSAGKEHLPYRAHTGCVLGKQGVVGSNPTSPTIFEESSYEKRKKVCFTF